MKATQSQKKILTVLRHVTPSEVGPPYDQFQAFSVENNRQLAELVAIIKTYSGQGDAE